jgi:hypothetical protein
LYGIIAGVKDEWWKEESKAWFQDPHYSLASEFYWTEKPKERQKRNHRHTRGRRSDLWWLLDNAGELGGNTNLQCHRCHHP